MTNNSSRERSSNQAATTSSPIPRSVEVEYWVVDSEGHLTAPGSLVDAAPGVEREFVEPLLEIKTTPCESTAELESELLGRLRRVLDAADEQGKHLVPLSTPASEATIEDRPSERTRIQDRVLGSDFEYVRHCAGTHIHVEQQPGREIDQLNTLIALDPALALVNSSQYYGGTPLAAGARSKLYRWMAYETLPHQGTLWRYAEDRTEWAHRLQRRYEEFLTESIMAGCDRETVEAEFGPESAVWTPIQLRQAFSTVEWRSPDTALPSQIIRLADDVVGTVERATTAPVTIEGRRGSVSGESVVLPEFETVQRYLQDAILDGLSANSVRSYLNRMGFDVDAYDPLTHELDDRGTLGPEARRDLRLKMADRLAEDVRQSTPMEAD